jgi:hypothetical protein
LGAPEFLARNQDLRAELLWLGDPTTAEQWYESQLNFLKNHCYWTRSARLLRDAGKQRNINELTGLLAGLRNAKR